MLDFVLIVMVPASSRAATRRAPASRKAASQTLAMTDEVFRISAPQNRELTAKERRALAMQLGGYSDDQIAVSLGISRSNVWRFLNKPRVDAERRRLLDGVELRFVQLAPAVYEAVADALRPDMAINTRLTAARLWMETVGWMQHGDAPSSKVTAEDVARELVRVVMERRGEPILIKAED